MIPILLRLGPLPLFGHPLTITIYSYGLMMALGSICFVLALSYLPVGTTTAISTSYVVLVAVLSWIFLDEEMTVTKLAGIALTVSGVGLLSWKAS